MQNLESEGAGRSVSTQTGSMTGECLRPCFSPTRPPPLSSGVSAFPTSSALRFLGGSSSAMVTSPQRYYLPRPTHFLDTWN